MQIVYHEYVTMLRVISEPKIKDKLVTYLKEKIKDKKVNKFYLNFIK
jgi:hypothetical protein